MRYPIHVLNRTFIRGLRRRPPTQKPAEFIEDATTFADTHTVLNDPFSRLPYPPNQLVDYLNKAQKSNLEKVAKKTMLKTQYLGGALNFDHIPIEKQVFVFFPGQGEQHIGMAKHLKDNKPAMELFERAGEYLKYDLWDLCQHGPKSKLDQTIYCNVSLFVRGIASIEKLRGETADFDERLTHLAGFGVGEFCALVAGGILKFDDALKIVDEQARIIHECNQLVACKTFVVQVNAASQLDQAIKEAKQSAIEKGEMPLCEISGFLYCGVKMIGASQLCKKFMTENSERFKFKVVTDMPMIGAPYTSLMCPAERSMSGLIKGIEEIGKPTVNVFSNYTGMTYPYTIPLIRKCIAHQFKSPIKWEQIMQLIYRTHKNYKFPQFYEVGSGEQIGKTLFKTSKKAHANYVPLNY